METVRNLPPQHPGLQPIALTVPKNVQADIFSPTSAIYPTRFIVDSDKLNLRQITREERCLNTKEAIANRILQLCDERNIAINELANISGVSPSTVYSILNEKSQNPGAITIKKLCDGFEITLGEFFSSAEFDALEQEIK